MSSSSSNLSFGVRNPVGIVNINRAPPATCFRITKADMGATGTTITPNFIDNHTIVVSPSTAGQVYTLPSASLILSEFGKNVDTGIPKLGVGDSLLVDIVNRGNNPAVIATASAANGGDGTQLVCATGSAGIQGVGFTGAVIPRGRLTTLTLEFLEVNGSVAGATGLYTIY